MPDINNAVALGVAVPRQPDIIGPISSLAQLQYLGANAQKVQAETGQIGLSTQFAQGKLQALQNYNTRVQGGELPESALISSGLATYDPQGASATLGNIRGERELAAIRNYQPGNPESLAAGGPEFVGKELSNQSTAATTQKTQLESVQAQTQLFGQVGNVMASDPSPKGRALAASIARAHGVPEAQIQQFINLPDDQYVLAGQHFQQAALTPEKYMDVSGQAAYNKGIAEAATANKTLGPTDVLSQGPAAAAAMRGQPVPPMPGTSLGTFAPNSAPSLTPAAQPPVASQPNIRTASTVAVPSVGIAIPQVLTDVANKYGISPAYLGRTYQIESGGNPNAYNTQSKAAGPFQFVPSTAAKYVPGGKVFDLAASAEGAAKLALDNKAELTQALGRPPTDAELYLAHQQGAAGAAKLLLNPNARAGDLVGNSAIASNGGNPNAPASAFTGLWATKFNGGVGKSIPSAAVAPNATPQGTPAGPLIPGATAAPLPATLSPPAPPQGTVAPIVPAPAPAPAAPSAPNAAGPTNAPLYQPVMAGMGPTALHEQEGYGTSLGKLPEELDKAASSAKSTNAILDQMADASEGWRMGKWADKEEAAREGLQAVAKTFGVNTPELDSKIANYQDFAKLSGNILRQASHEASSRVGVQEMQLISKSLPSPEMSEGGFRQVATQLKGMNDFAIAKQQAAADWKAKYGTLAAGKDTQGKDFQATWNANASPAAFVLHRMQLENPAALQNLIGTMSKTPEGQTALKNLKIQMQWANTHGLFG